MLSVWVPGIAQLSLFALVMLLASWLMLRPVKLDVEPVIGRAMWKIATDGLLVGVVTGLVGLGVGIRVLKDQQTGYGYTSELSLPAMQQAALTAAAIAAWNSMIPAT